MRHGEKTATVDSDLIATEILTLPSKSSRNENDSDNDLTINKQVKQNK